MPVAVVPIGDEVRPTKVLDLLKKPSFLAVVVGAAFISFAGYSLTTFAPAYLIRTRGMSLGEVGWQYGLASGLTGILSLLIVGRVADRLSARDPRWALWLVAAMTAAMLPFSALAFLVQSQTLCIWFIALSYVVGTAYMAPSISAIQRLARAEERATASAIFLFFGAMLGSAGPFLTGVISDALKADLGNVSLGRALLVVPVAQVVAIICYLAASQRFMREIVDR
jgi:cyanate permease